MYRRLVIDLCQYLMINDVVRLEAYIQRSQRELSPPYVGVVVGAGRSAHALEDRGAPNRLHRKMRLQSILVTRRREL